MTARICKRGHVVNSKGMCRECKRLRDRVFKAKKPRPELTPEQIEERRRKNREAYAQRMKDPDYAKKRSKRAYQDFVNRTKKDPAQLEKHKARMANRWRAIKSNPDRLQVAREQSRESSKRYYHRQFDRPDPKAVAEKAKAKAEALAQQARMGIERIAYS